ncbi:hypothetical protein PISMIDRAFT_578460 [Pisolithus microcarpus 441]|uniref:Uncharacterized protein n=1 Tax=Pisolithus microcarpus 441 TaxID=765257 RepID=A0A0C9YV24_9AGAM|nr:hypothetical protein BKA83DRAFT_578460 [Pisolithus microcarpus]KIK20601.1 hypothetical protein PISMIDRAFT_578460 [Pisolithus microcarpus 441]
MPTASGPSEFYVNHLTTSNVFVHGSGVQSTANPYDVPLEPSDLLDAGFIAPPWPIPSMNLVQATGFNTSVGHPTLGQEYMGQYRSGISAAGTSVCAPNSANSASFPSEVPEAHTFPAQLADFATSVLPQGTAQFSSDLRPCEWRNNQGGICRQLVGWHCESHLASEHRIRKLPAHMVIVCGACGEEKKRKFFLRHFREVHLGFHRGRRNAT